LIDAALTLVNAIQNDAELSASLSGGVYAYRIPPEAAPPLAVVQVPFSRPSTSPQTIWWDIAASIDLHSESPQESVRLADEMQRLVPSIVGNTLGGVVADCQVDSTASIPDGGWTPTRYRQVVTVTLTAREP
jgi:hypothetical protein